MKLNRLETHDRYEYLVQDQSKIVQQGAEDCLKRNKLSLAYQERSPYVYLYAHMKTADDGVTKRLIWEPRLTKGPCHPNTYLFRAISKTDTMEVIWILPQEETWSQFKKENITSNKDVIWSINQYKTNRHILDAPEKDDLPDHVCKNILLDVAREIEEDIRMRKLYVKPASSEPFQDSLMK